MNKCKLEMRKKILAIKAINFWNSKQKYLKKEPPPQLLDRAWQVNGKK